MADSRSQPLPLAGRRHERQWLDDVLDKVAVGNPRVVVLAGEAGVGKSRLVRDAIERHTGEWLIGIGHCLEEGQLDLPYSPLSGILSAVGRTEVGRELLDEALANWPGLLPFADGAAVTTLIDTTSGLSQLRLLDSLTKLFGELARSNPTLIVIEDAHWADPATRAFVSYLARNVVADPLALILTVRTDELHRQHPLRPLLAELARLPTVARLDVDPLDESDLAELLAGLAGSPLPRRVVRGIADRSGGNPFFAEQLLAVGVAATEPAGELADLLLQRVDRLGPAARRLLSVASLAGRWVAHDVLRAVYAVADGDVTDAEFTAAIREAADHRLFGPDDSGAGYQFHHALLAEAIAADLLPGERAPLHARYAAVLDARTSPAAVARHLVGAGDFAGAFDASVAAAEAAMAVAAADDALAHWNRVLDLWDEASAAAHARAGGRSAVLLHAAQAAAGAGLVNQARRFARAAVDAATTPTARAEARLALAGLLAPAAAGAQSADEARAAIADAGDDGALVARGTAALARAHYLAGRFDAAVQPAEEAAAAAAQIGLEAVALGARATAFLARRELGEEPDGAEDTERELVTLASSTPDVETGLWVLTRLAEWSFRTDLAAGERLARDAYEFAARRGVRSSVQGVWARETLTLCRLLNGNWDAVQELAATDPLPINDLTTGTVSLEAQVEIHRGQLAQSRRRLELAQRVAPDALGQAFVGIAWISQLLAEDDPVAAVQVCLDRLAALPRVAAHQPIEASLIARGVGALATAHELGLTPSGADELLAAADRVLATADATLLASRTSSPVSLLLAHRSRLTHSDVGLWREAVAQRTERPYDQSVCRYHLARALLHDGDTAAAADELRQAASTFRRLGAVVMLDHVEQLAHRARIRLDDAAADARPAAERWSLTERELQVLRLVADGQTNRQIGEALFISSRTAGVHVSNIMTKLGAATRGEAAAIAQRSGLLA